MTTPTEPNTLPSPPPAPQIPTRSSIGTIQRWIMVLLLMFLVVGQFFQAVLPTRWEYTIIAPSDQEFERVMYEAGSRGWEVVSARRATSGEGSSSKAAYEMILKRPVVGVSR